MKKSKLTEAQIIFAIKQSETGVSVAEVCRKMGISGSTSTKEEKYGGLEVRELCKLRLWRRRTGTSGQLVADLRLDKQMLQDVLK